MRTDELIVLLVKDGGRRPSFGALLSGATLAGLCLAAFVYFAILRPRPDLLQALGTPRVLLKFAVALPLGVVSFRFLDRVARPGAPYGPWPWLFGPIAALLALGVAAELVAMPHEEWLSRLVGSNARYCLMLIPLIAAAPLACLLWALRHGAPSHPRLAGAVAGLTASGMAATLYATHCPDDSPLFMVTWYGLATAIVTLVGSTVAKRVLSP